MKNKIIVCTLIPLFALLLFRINSAAAASPDNHLPVSVTLKTDKTTYVLGEVVEVEFTTENSGKTPLSIYEPSVDVGSLKIFVANPNDGFKEYTTFGWGRVMGRKKDIQPGQKITDTISILWNGHPNIDGWSELYAKPIRERRIMTDYAFPGPGVYFIKAAAYVVDANTPLETEPVQIVVNQPLGDDLSVWEQIKNNSEIAYLLQNGDLQEPREDQKAKLVNMLNALLARFPNSTYSESLRINLEKYKQAELRRKEFDKNIKSR